MAFLVSVITSKALVSDLKVGRGVDGTWSGGVELWIWEGERASSTGGAAGVEQRQDVRRTADVAQVTPDTAS